jgi:nickel-dependent lactate racemase
VNLKMHNFNLKLGKEKINLQLEDNNYLGNIALNKELSSLKEEEIVRNSILNPIKSNKLDEIISPEDKICIIISDVTRMYQRPHVFLPILIEEILKAGGKEENIFFISSLGSHRKHTKEEHITLLGEELYDKFPIEDHDCDDYNNLVEIGTTTRGTVVEINKKAYEADKIIVTGALVYHVMSGWGGGRKSIVPGIASRKTIMVNHSISISEIEGQGPNPKCDCALYDENPLNLDMIEAAEMLKPDFMFNVILGEGKIIAAVSGDITEAHKVGCQLVSEFNDVPIKEKSDMIIASCGGYPKDINFYQSTKVIYNAMRAVKDNGVIIVLADCNEGFGNPEVQFIIERFENNLQREMELRKNYTISKYIGFLAAWYASKYNIIYVSNIAPNKVKSAGIIVVKTIEDALNKAYEIKGRKDLKAYVMPDGGLYPVVAR